MCRDPSSGILSDMVVRECHVEAGPHLTSHVTASSGCFSTPSLPQIKIVFPYHPHCAVAVSFPEEEIRLLRNCTCKLIANEEYYLRELAKYRQEPQQQKELTISRSETPRSTSLDQSASSSTSYYPSNHKNPST
ncbi:hypothetical protein O0I10_010832 [Lichtheimia ornata]|uniref:Uncharacterized protein n=1 Tax=Lichtheimia ornata TaxID=688661 RepID=A0AAD7UVD0_9FUNG|nr:uncharacterized protein O0I10_010832 [Lichtheimia ornata]KAJ8653504.1 hypothetical protein O0I10_010832 [Lichtheimia ornata]